MANDKSDTPETPAGPARRPGLPAWWSVVALYSSGYLFGHALSQLVCLWLGPVAR